MKKKKKLLLILLIVFIILIVLTISIWLLFNFISGFTRDNASKNVNNDQNTTQNENVPTVPVSSITLGEAFATGWLSYYYPNSNNPLQYANCSVSYSFYTTTNWTTMKTMVSAKMENITVTTGLQNYTKFVFPIKHLKYDDFPSGIGINEMYPDGMIMYRDKLASLTNVGTGYDIAMSTKAVPDYQDEITSTYGYAHFGIKLVDFAHFTYNINDSFSKSSSILAASGLSKTDLNAEIDYDLVLTFTDGTSETKHINIKVDGNKMEDYSMPRQDYTK
ncbi:hypothetical protein M0R04_01055 [Candidatus Dojkabacteria bacterium]|jgi:hypothetical protein|nr:hypothetical protein [Candidatus Dojkabacteria bacterium]